MQRYSSRSDCLRSFDNTKITQATTTLIYVILWLVILLACVQEMKYTIETELNKQGYYLRLFGSKCFSVRTWIHEYCFAKSLGRQSFWIRAAFHRIDRVTLVYFSHHFGEGGRFILPWKCKPFVDTECFGWVQLFPAL